MSSFLSLSSAALLFALSSGTSATAATAPSATTASPSPAKSVLPWIADDYATAVAEAKRRGVPLFVEAWAPW